MTAAIIIIPLVLLGLFSVPIIARFTGGAPEGEEIPGVGFVKTGKK